MVQREMTGAVKDFYDSILAGMSTLKGLVETDMSDLGDGDTAEALKAIDGKVWGLVSAAEGE